MRPGDAAADLPAQIEVEIPAGERCLVPTGFAVAVPLGACGLVLPRSGLALKHGLTLLNSPGLIDSGYRGELKVLLYNTSRETVLISRGQRIAQFLVLAVDQLGFVEVSDLPAGPDDRGSDGFGSSGEEATWGPWEVAEVACSMAQSTTSPSDDDVLPPGIDRERVQSHTLRVLMSSQVLGGMGLVAGYIPAALLAKEITGSAGWAGLAAAMLWVGSSGAAFPLASYMYRHGRRPGLRIGYLVGATGAIAAFGAALLSFYPLLLLGVAMI
ncbi:MAG: dUTP diphosphatase, partial [Actinomycetia bacterium]|nr:dUTP diphosphatase [Actinomycetes bacterium]